MQKSIMSIILVLAMAVLFAGCGSDQQEASGSSGNSPNKTDGSGEPTELTISAAISMTDAMEAIRDRYEDNHDVELTFNLGSSGKLAQQIQQGAPADVFISANQDWMDTLEEKGDIKAETRADIVRNKIVLVQQEDGDSIISDLEDLDPAELEQITIGNPDSVPAGKYAKQTLESHDKWEALEEDIILGKDARQVLTYVETGNAAIGFVYGSDAQQSDSVEVIAEAEQDMHDPIIYPAAVTVDTEKEEAALEFIEYLKTDQAIEIFKEYGFSE